MGGVISTVLDKILSLAWFSLADIVWPITKVLLYFMGFVLVLTFIGNIAGILGFFIFILMLYYYVKGIIFIEPSS